VRAHSGRILLDDLDVLTTRSSMSSRAPGGWHGRPEPNPFPTMSIFDNVSRVRAWPVLRGGAISEPR